MTARWAFLAACLGAAAVLGGAGWRAARGVRGILLVPVTPEQFVCDLRMPDGTQRPLEFGVSVVSFEVRYYDPDYMLVRVETDPNAPGKRPELIRERTVHVFRDGTYDLGKLGRLPAARLKTADGEGWIANYRLSAPGTAGSDSWVLHRIHEPIVREYRAVLRIMPEEGTERDYELAVNRPVDYNGWRFYLSTHWDEDERRLVALDAKRDPGRRVTFGGMWVMMLGVAALCWCRREEEARDGNS